MARTIKVRRIRVIRRTAGPTMAQPLNGTVRPMLAAARPVGPSDQWANISVIARPAIRPTMLGQAARMVPGLPSRARTGTPVFIFGAPQFIADVKEALVESKSVTVMGSASDLVRATPLAALARSQVVIIDANVGGVIDGARVARSVQRSFGNCSPVILLRTMNEEAVVWLRKLHREGNIQWSIVTGKGMTRVGEFEVAIQSAARGLRWVQPELKAVLERVKVEAAQSVGEERAKAAAQPGPVYASTAAPERSSNGLQMVGSGRPGSRPANVGSTVTNYGAVPVNANTRVEW